MPVFGRPAAMERRKRPVQSAVTPVRPMRELGPPVLIERSLVVMAKPRIAVFSGPTATISNSPDLVTSEKARSAHRLSGLTSRTGDPVRFDVLRPQRLAAPVTVFVEAFSAHPLEADAAELYAPPDGWVDAKGDFHRDEPVDGTPVYVVELRPDDGLYLLPYMARQTDGAAWEATTARPLAVHADTRQTFYADASRVYEEIDRFGVDDFGRPVALTSLAEFDFFRAAPSAGYTKLSRDEADSGISRSDVAPDRLGTDFFPYYPDHLWREPSLGALARATTLVQSVLSTGSYVGAQWLEGSPTTEETLYWLGLLVDTTVPLVGHSAQRRHQALSADGDRNIVDGVKYLTSGVALDQHGRDQVGAVMIVDEMVYTARDVTKIDARPGGYEVAGGHGGVVADMGGEGPPQLTFVPARRHTWCSDVRLARLPGVVSGVSGSLEGGVRTIEVVTKAPDGSLVPTAMPIVTLSKYSRYTEFEIGVDESADPRREVEIFARIAANLAGAPLAGFVLEGMSPYAMADPEKNAALAVATFAGMPVVRVGRGNTGGMASRDDPTVIAGNNLTATKARMLLMAALLKLGALPPAADPFRPSDREVAATIESVAAYQRLFDTH